MFVEIEVSLWIVHSSGCGRVQSTMFKAKKTFLRPCVPEVGSLFQVDGTNGNGVSTRVADVVWHTGKRDFVEVLTTQIVVFGDETDEDRTVYLKTLTAEGWKCDEGTS